MVTHSNRSQLQELYRFLDCTGREGDTYISWYGQLRAEEVPHDEALARTVEHFGLWRYDWWRRRFA